MNKESTTHSIELSQETYELLQQVKKAFVSYSGEGLEDWSDSKVVDVLTGGFFDSMVRGEVDAGVGCCGESGCNSEKKDEGCCGGSCHC